MKKFAYFFTFFLILGVFSLSSKDSVPIEKLSVIVGIGNDYNPKAISPYSGTFENLVFKGNSLVESKSLTGTGNTIYTAQNNRQTKNNKQWLLAAEVLYLVNEARAREGLNDLLDAFIRDENRNENAYFAVCKQDTKEVFNSKSLLDSTMAEEIRGILESSRNANFFNSNTTIISTLLMYHQKGRNIVLPYLELIKGEPQITGLALFKQDKLIKVVNLDEALLINLLRNNNEIGFLSILTPNPKEYIDFSGKSKVKIKSSKEDNCLKYDIFVNLKGVLTVNSLDKKNTIMFDLENIEKVFSDRLKKQLNIEVQKMQQEYKTDWLDLGKYAVAKYGRHSDYDSDECFCNSKIDVHVSTYIDSSGRKSD